MNVPETIYRRRGRRYEAIGLSEVPLIVQPGWHLVHVSPGCTSTHFNINPDDACRRAGREMLVDELVPLLTQALRSDIPKHVPPKVAELQKRGLEAYTAVAGDPTLILERPSTYDLAMRIATLLERGKP